MHRGQHPEAIEEGDWGPVLDLLQREIDARNQAQVEISFEEEEPGAPDDDP